MNNRSSLNSNLNLKENDQNNDKNKNRTTNTDGDEIDHRSYWQMMVDGIVRPPRSKYEPQQLGKQVVTYRSKSYTRNDVNISHKGKKIQLTIFHTNSNIKLDDPYIILYMHGNSSCRLQGINLIRTMPQYINLACFDFMGCGRNEEENTVTLGYRQSEQVETITEYLKSKGFRVILWGRSMGAAAALLYGRAQFIVADSAFKSFKSLCKQVAKQHTPIIIPNCMVDCFFPCVFSKLKSDVRKKADYDVEDLDVKQAVMNMNKETTVLFMSGNRDVLVHKRNSEKLHKVCPCKKKYLKIVEGDHNSKRSDAVMTQIMNIITCHIQDNRQGYQEKVRNKQKKRVDQDEERKFMQ